MILAVEMNPAVATYVVRPPVVETREVVSPIMDDRRFGDEMNPAVAVNRVRPPVVETRENVSPIIEESRLGLEMNPAVLN